MAEVEKMGGFNIDSKEIVDLISGALSPKGSGSSKITKTIEIKTEFKGKPLEELKETYELIEKIQKKVGKRDARLDFFTKPDTALKHVVQAYKEMADLKEKGVPNKSETGEFVRWANAFQALGGSIEDIQKVLPKSVNVQDIITSFMKQSGGASGKGYDRYSVDAYKELFDLAKELEKLGYADMSTLSKRYAELPEEVGRVVEKTRQKIEEVKPSEPIISVDDIISQDKIKSRIDEIKKELKTIFEMDEGDFGLLFSGSSKKQINDILGDYYELVRYSEKIKSPDIVTSTETSAFERVLNRARVDGVKINATTETTARGRANKAYKEAEEMAIAARSMTKSAEEIDAARKKASEPQPASGGTSGNVEQAGEAARQARETAKQVGESARQTGEAAQDMGENGQQAGQKMAKGVEGAVSKLQELKSQLDEAKQKLEELEEQQSRIDKQFRDGKLFEEKLAIWRKYGKTSENPEQWLVQQVDEHIKEGKIEKAAIYRNILKANYKENNTPFFDEDGKEIKLAPIAKGFIQAYKANVTTDNLNDINKQVLAQRELVEGLQAQFDAEEKLDNIQKRNDEQARKFSESYKEKMSLDGTPEKVSAKYEELFQKITSGAIKSSEAIKELKTFIEQLGLAFDESNQKWVAISSEAKDITKEIGQTFGITDEKVLDQISIQIQGMVDTLKGGGKLDTNGLFDIFKAKFKTREENEDYKEVRSWLKPKSVYVPEGAKTEFGDNYMQYIRAIGTRNITHKLGEGAQLFEFARQSEVFSRIFGDAINEFEMFEKLAQFLIKEKASVVKSPFDTEKTEESIKLLDILQSKLKEIGLLREEATRTDENGFLIPEEQLSQGIEELLKKSKLTREEIVQLEEELQRLKSVTSIPTLDFDGDTLDENIRKIEEKLSIEKEAFQGSAQDNPTEEAEEQTGAIIDRNNQSLKERLEYLKMLRNESRFMETADDKRIDMEEKAWDAGGENSKTDEEAQRKITAYEDHITRMENADELLNEFERTYEQVVITLKSGEQIIVHSVDDLEGLSLAMAKISDIKFVPFPNEEDHLDGIRQEYESLISEIESANKDSLNLVDYKSIEEAQSGIEKLEDALTKLKSFRKDNAEDLDLMDETSYDLDAFIEKLQNVKKHYEGQLEQLDRKKRYGFMTEANGLEGYKSADQSFVTALAAQVAEGTKQYDEAMEELKEHIKQKQEEVRQEQERNQRVNGELSKFVSGTNPIIEAMGLAQDEPRPQAYGDFISQIQSESIKGEEAVTEFAKAVGYAYDEVSKTWQKIQSTQGSQPDVQQEITSTEQLISVINELEKIYGQFQRPKYKIQDPSYLGELYDRVDILDMSGYNDTSATEENIENLRAKMMEIYNLYKKITSAINNNNGWYKGVQYTSDDQKALIGNFKAYAQAYHELVTEYNKRETWAQKEIGINPQYLKTLDVVVQGLTKDFKGYAQEVITDSQSVKENNQLYVEEQEQLKQSNALLRERYELLRDMVIGYAKKQGTDYDKRSLIQDLIPPLSDDEDYYYEWGESFEHKSNNVLQDILKLLGIDIPEAAQKAESAIDGVTQQGENSSQASLDISQVTNIDQLSEYVKQLDIAKASTEELQSILSKAKEFGGLSSLPSDQVAQLTARMEELGIASEQAAEGEMQAAHAAQAGAAADNVAAGAAQQAADADERAADANEKKANADAQGASAASASAEGDATGAQGASGEAQGFTALGQEVGTVKQLVQEKNDLIKQEVDYVNQNLPGEIQQFKDLSDAINMVKEKLEGIIETLPNVKFDFTGQDSTTKMTTFLSDISGLNQALKDLDGKDVFHHLSDILNASDVNLTNNLNYIIQKFKELKEVMNGFDDNGTAVFKSLSDLANAGDQLVDKMQKLFKESGVKLPTVAQKQTQDKTKATELMATKSEEISSFVLSDIKRAPEELEHVSTKMEAMGNGIVKVTQVVSQALEDGSLAFREYTYRIKETEDGFSIEDKKIQKDGLALEKQALAYKKFVDQMDKVSQKVEPIYDGKGKMMTITPETEGWEQLVELAHRFGVEMENAVKVTRIVQNGRESFQFDMSNGNAVRLGMNSNNILIEKNPIIDKKAEETAAKQRGKDVEELANSYLKLAEAEHKAEESRQKTGIEDQRYTKEVNDLKQRQIELTEKLGTLSEEEQKRISSGQNYANLQRERYGMTTQDVDKEFGTAAQAYDTLIKKMKQYYSIIEKQSLGKPLTIGDQAFLQKYGTYFEQAGRAAKGASEDIGIFADKSQQALEAQERFRQETEIMNANMVDRYESNLLSQITSLEPVGEDKTDIYNTKVVQVQEQFKKLQEIGAQIKLGNTEQADEYLNLTKEIQGEINKINSGSYNFADPTKVAKLDRQMADWNAKNTGAPSEYVEQIKSFRSTLSQGLTGEEFDAVVQGFERTKAAAAEAGSVGASFVDGLKQRMRSLGQYLLSFASFYRIIGVFRKAFTIVKDLDSAMTEMRKVSEESVETLSRYQFESFDMADKVGTTAKQIQDSTADWLRLGRTFEQSKTLAEQSTVLLNVSEFENINDATQALVSATQAYDELDAQTIIDKLNLIGNNFAVSTSDLAQGLQNAAAVLKTQGNDIDQSLALLTAGNLIGQDISKASMGIRTISLRISGKNVPERMVTYGHVIAC